jgi:cardiolipin synthase A/B
MKRLLKRLSSKPYVISFLVLFQLFLVYVALYQLTAWVPLLYFFFVGVAFALSVYIISLNINPSYKLSWIFMILSFPLIGVTNYLLFGGRKVPKDLRTGVNQLSLDKSPLLVQDQAVLEDLITHCPRATKGTHYLLKNTEYPVYNDSEVTYYPTGESKYAALLEELNKAQRFIFMEYFIVKEGQMLDTIVALLREKVTQGVEVKLIFDDFGAIHLPKSFKAQLKSYGIDVYFFNPIRPLLAIYMNNRDHRKIAVIDGKVGFIGGINLADEYINVISRFGHWKDTAIKVEGNAVFGLSVMFLHFWRHLTKQAVDFEAYRVVCESRPDGYVQLFSDSPTDEELVAENAHLNLINEARRTLYIMTPYLVIGHEMLTALMLSAKSGVDVRIIVPHIPDKRYVLAVTRSNYDVLTQAGVRIYEYTPGFLHAKVMLIDDQMAIVGTSNLDFRSYYMHFECGALISKSKSLLDMKRDFLDTLKVSQEITYAMTQQVPPLVRLGRMLLNVFNGVL